MVATELIPGMEELVNHIRELEEKLEEEKSGREHDVQQFQSVLDEKGKLEAEVEELKEENKNLKDQVFHGTTKDEIKEIYRVTMKLQEENKKLQEESDLLQHTNKNLRKQINHRKKKLEEWGEENKKLKEEIERLRGYFGVENKKLKDDYQELKEENKKLKDAKIVVARESFQQKVREATEKFREMVNAMGEENKKLKDDLERMKRWTDRALRDNEELKEEKEILCKFLGGNYDEGSAVEEILKGYFSEDFIKANKETWDYYQIFQ